MAQFGRPSADTSIGTYTDQAAGVTNIYTTIDESVASDADYIQSVLAPSSAPYATKLTNLEDPISSTGHVVRWRVGKSAAGGATLNVTVQLRQGYVSEGTPGTLIASKGPTAVPDAFTDDSLTLSGAEADSITDYTSLYLRFVVTTV
jgi:hypothetical protein